MSAEEKQLFLDDHGDRSSIDNEKCIRSRKERNWMFAASAAFNVILLAACVVLSMSPSWSRVLSRKGSELAEPYCESQWMRWMHQDKH